MRLAGGATLRKFIKSLKDRIASMCPRRCFRYIISKEHYSCIMWIARPETSFLLKVFQRFSSDRIKYPNLLQLSQYLTDSNTSCACCATARDEPAVNTFHGFSDTLGGLLMKANAYIDPALLGLLPHIWKKHSSDSSIPDQRRHVLHV